MCFSEDVNNGVEPSYEKTKQQTPHHKQTPQHPQQTNKQTMLGNIIVHIPPTVRLSKIICMVLNDTLLACNTCVNAPITVQRQPSYCLTTQYHSLWF